MIMSCAELSHNSVVFRNFRKLPEANRRNVEKGRRVLDLKIKFEKSGIGK